MKKLFILTALLFCSAIFAATVDETQLDKDCQEFHKRVLHWRAEGAQIEGKKALLQAAQDKCDQDQLKFKADLDSKDEATILLIKEQAARVDGLFQKIKERKAALDVLIAAHEKERLALREELVRLTNLAVKAKHEAAEAQTEKTPTK